MLLLALKSALAKKLRLFSTALSVLLGVAFLTGTLVFTDTLRRTFDDLFADVYDNTDSYVRSSASLDLGFGETQRGRIPDDLLATVREVDGVDDVRGVVSSFAQIVAPDGEPIGDPANGAPTFAMSWVAGALSPWQLAEGGRAPGPGEVVVDQHSADVGDLSIGDDITLLTQTGPHELTLVGTVRFGSVESPGGASVSLLDLATSQELLLGGAHELDAIMVHAAPGIDEATLTARIGAELPDGTEVLTGSEITDETQQTMHDAMGFFNTFLLVFAAIGLVVACFTIYNTFQIVVTQRTREMALLRSVGATRTQVLWAQLLEALLVGVAASMAGLAAGIGVARGLKALMGAIGIDIPGGGTVFEARTAIVALTVGITVTVVAAVFPSLRASRIPPLAALRGVAVDVSGQSRRRLLSGGVMTLIGVVAYIIGLAGNGLEWVGVGALATFVGVFMLGPLIARPVAGALGAPAAATGITGTLARENAMRNPKRTSRTGGALMVGVALVAAITVIAASMRDWTRDVYDDQFTGDYVASSDLAGYGGVSTDLAEEVSALPEVDVATGIRFGAAHVLDEERDVRYVAVDPSTAGRLFDLGMDTGRIEDLTADGVLLDVDEAAGRGATIGDRVPLTFLDGTTRWLTVQGTYERDDLAGEFVVSHELHELTGVDQFDTAVYIQAARGVPDSQVLAALDSVVGAYANVDAQSREEYIDSQASQYDQILNLMYGLLALAVLIALINIANSLALSIHERTHELGLLRAVGTTRTQTSSSVIWEAVLVALLGTLIGLVLGTFFGWSISVVGRGVELDAFVVPITPLVLIGVLAVIGAVAASVRPAWRAAHLDVLRAIATE
jgi:putative ABC transport system permease protein